MMQEIKTEDVNFPYDDFSAIDYESHVFGQKSYNGVAIISKGKLKNIKISYNDLPEWFRKKTTSLTIDEKKQFLENFYKESITTNNFNCFFLFNMSIFA